MGYNNQRLTNFQGNVRFRCPLSTPERVKPRVTEWHVSDYGEDARRSMRETQGLVSLRELILCPLKGQVETISKKVRYFVT